MRSNDAIEGKKRHTDTLERSDSDSAYICSPFPKAHFPPVFRKGTLDLIKNRNEEKRRREGKRKLDPLISDDDERTS
jgi:hypothetical protein